jgi:hypothetical protein
MNKCLWCLIEFKFVGSHYASCKKAPNLPKEELKIKFIENKINLSITKEWFENLYVTQHYSMPDLKQNFNLEYRDTEFLIEYFHLHKRNISETALSERSRKKFTDTCIARYGVDNISKSEKIKSKKEATFLDHYGVKNIFSTKEFRNNHHAYMMAVYGKGSLSPGGTEWWDNLAPEEQIRRLILLREGGEKWFANLTEEEKLTHNQKKFVQFWKKEFQNWNFW